MTVKRSPVRASRSEVLKVRVTPVELAELRANARALERPVAWVLHRLIVQGLAEWRRADEDLQRLARDA